jgi:DNA-directed RNA polymerase subunit RPC12/RpoP
MKLDRTGQTYGQLQALYDTGKRTKKAERVWAARCLNVRKGSACGRIIETHKLGQKDGPVRCPDCSKALYCQPRDISGQVFNGWRASLRYQDGSGDWRFECLECGRRVRRHGSYASKLVPCRKCNPLPRARRPQRPCKAYPALGCQIGLTRLKLAEELSAGKVVEIPVGVRYSAFVDAADAPKVLAYQWRVSPENGQIFYACASLDGKEVSMHRLILGLTDPRVTTDHRDHCGVNNTRANIRPATHQQNSANTRKRSGHTSKYKGVSWKTGYGRWVATIELGGKKKHLGYFDDEIEAARAYNAAAVERFGEFACLNDVPERKPPVSVGLERKAA